MLGLEQVFRLVTSLTLVCLAMKPGLSMTLSEDQRVSSTMMAPGDDQSEPTSPMTATKPPGRRYTEPREIQEHINHLFTYPGRPMSRARTAPPMAEVPSCATERAYCTETEEGIPDDVSDAVNQLLGASPGFRQQFDGTDILTQEDQTIVERGPDDPSDTHLCGVEVELTRVTWATSEDDVIMRIAQSKDFAQTVRLERCTEEDCRCHEIFTSGLLRPYRARCKQKYVYRKLLALTEDAKKQLRLATHSFPLPSCCSCVITKELNYKDERKCDPRISDDSDTRIAKDSPPPSEQPPNSNSTASAHPPWAAILVTTLVASRLG